MTNKPANTATQAHTHGARKQSNTAAAPRKPTHPARDSAHAGGTAEAEPPKNNKKRGARSPARGAGRRHRAPEASPSAEETAKAGRAPDHPKHQPHRGGATSPADHQEEPKRQPRSNRNAGHPDRPTEHRKEAHDGNYPKPTWGKSSSVGAASMHQVYTASSTHSDGG